MSDDLVHALIMYCERGRCAHHLRQRAATYWLNKIKAARCVPEETINEMERLRAIVRTEKRSLPFVDRVMEEVRRHE